MSMLTPQTALIVVDVQTGTASYQHARPIRDVVANVNAIAQAVRDTGGHVVIVRHDPARTPSGATQYGGRPRPAPVAYGNLLVERFDGDTNISRGGWSTFAGTDLHEQLVERGITRVIIVGQATTFGVESSARAAYDLGYDVVLVEDASNDPSSEAHTERFRSVFPALGCLIQTADLTMPSAT